MEDIAATVLRAEVESRLRPVCPDWPEALFQALVSQIVELTLKYDRRPEGEFVLDPRITEQLIAEMKDLVERSAEVREEAPDPPPSRMTSCS